MNTNTLPAEPINFGACGWRLPDVGITFGSQDNARQYAADHGLQGEPAHFDTRPTVSAVRRMLGDAENDACNVPERERAFGVGPWDEYFSSRVQPSDKWPDHRWIAVFVVRGSSEGLYLHIEAIDADGGRTLLILGKTCNCSRDGWIAAYASAGRLSYLLNS